MVLEIYFWIVFGLVLPKFREGFKRVLSRHLSLAGQIFLVYPPLQTNFIVSTGLGMITAFTASHTHLACLSIPKMKPRGKKSYELYHPVYFSISL